MENSCRKKHKPSPKKWILASRHTGFRRNSALVPANAGLFHYAGNNPVRYIDPDGKIKKEADGSFTFFPSEDAAYSTGNSGKKLLFQWGTIKANDGTDIKARLNLSDYRPENSNCHGFTFTNGTLWIQPDQVELLLKGDGYKETKNPEVGGIFVQYDKDVGAYHSGKILEVDNEKGIIKVEEAIGVEVFKRKDGKIYDTIIQSRRIMEMGNVKFYKNNGDSIEVKTNEK